MWYCMVDHVVKMLTLKFHFFFFKEAEEVQYKRKTLARRVVQVGRSLAGNKASESSAFGIGFFRLMPASDLPPRTTRLRVFFFKV